ncbi:MAG: DUF2867 domain-containing protein [Pseudomonadota bacterium]
MNIKQRVITEKLEELPENITLVDKYIDYLSCQHQEILKGITAQQAYITMTSCQPKWLSILFKVRDAFAKLGGVEAVKGFNNLQGKDFNINDKMHFFNIVEKSDDRLTLVIRDSHLDVCLCMVIVENADKPSINDLHLVTSVKNKNFFGKLYMLPVSIIHPFIAKKLLVNINEQ